MLTQKYLNELSYQVIGACIEVHKALGPGLLESVYHVCLEHELGLRGIACKSEMMIPLRYKGIELQTNLRCDFFIEDCMVLEIKSVESLLPVFEAQVLAYMKMIPAPKGLLVNFNSANIFHEGQKTLVNHLFSALPER